MKRHIVVSLLLAIMLILSGCSEQNSSESTTYINGKVVDGYVKNSKIQIFDDNTYTNLIGEGSTDSNGSFTIGLNITNLPEPIYIKSTGGVIIDNGMPAPTMLFSGNKNSKGEYIITPITNIIAEKEKSGLDINQITTQLATDLDLTKNELFIDPETETNTKIKDILKQKVLPASTFASNLADGNYNAYILYFDQNFNNTITSVNDLEQNIIPASINIKNGNIDGSFEYSGIRHGISGYVSGTTFLLELNFSSNDYVSLAGTVGLYGSVAGVAATFNNSSITPGVFVGQVVPQDINDSQIDQMVADTNNTITGKENLLFRLNIGGTGMGIGEIDSIDVNDDRSLTLSNVDVTDEVNNTVTLTANSESKFLSINGNRTNLAVMKFVANDNTPVYFIQPVGLRKGVIITTDNNNKINEIGDAYITKSDTIAPALKTETNYTMKFGFVDKGMLGIDRNSILPFLSESQNINTSNINTSDVDSYLRKPIRIELDNEVMFFNDSVIGMYSKDSNYMRTFQIYNSGAFDGEHISGENDPGFFVGYLKEQDSTATASPDGEYYFIARSLYFQDSPTLIRGKLIIKDSGNTATIEISDENGSFPLKIDCTDGLCHMQGYGSEEDYIDMVWPIGGKKGLFVVSKGESGEVFEVGEGFISQ